jgi:hypothetical protein
MVRSPLRTALALGASALLVSAHEGHGQAPEGGSYMEKCV